MLVGDLLVHRDAISPLREELTRFPSYLCPATSGLHELD